MGHGPRGAALEAPTRHDDVATIYNLLGMPPETELPDTLAGRFGWAAREKPSAE